MRGLHEVRLQSPEYAVTVVTNLTMIADAVRGMKQGDTMQEVIEQGARKQWDKDASWIMEVMIVTMPSTSTYWDDMTGDTLDTEEVRKARKLEI